MASAAIIAANNALIIANIQAEQERYDNDPVYRMAVLENNEARTRKKIKHDLDRIHNPRWYACCRDHEKALTKHQQRLRDIKEAEAKTRPLLPQTR